MIELFKTTRASMKFDRMIPSGSSWPMGIQVHRVFDQAHAAVEPGKTITISKFHQITGHTGEHLLKPTANYMKLKLLGRLPPCEICAKAKIRQRNIPKEKIKKMATRPGYRVFIDISSFKQVSRGGNRHWLIVVDEFSDYAHSFFLNKKSDQIKILPMWCWKPSSLLSNVHFRNTTKIAVQVLLLLTLFTFTFEPFLKL